MRAQKKKAVLRVRVAVNVLRAAQHRAIDLGVRLADVVTTALREHLSGAPGRESGCSK
jgi:hypothetical protein